LDGCRVFGHVYRRRTFVELFDPSISLSEREACPDHGGRCPAQEGRGDFDFHRHIVDLFFV
jgi:hypothetical protein